MEEAPVLGELSANELAELAIEVGSTVESGTELVEITTCFTNDINRLKNVRREEKDRLIGQFKSELKTQYGARNENNAVKHYEMEENETVRDKNKFYKLTLGTICPM